MRAAVRLNLLVAGIFLLALMLSLFGLMRQAKTDIQRELVAGMALADQLVEQVEDDPGRLDRLLALELRHMHLMKLAEGEFPNPPVNQEVPGWFAGWVWSADMPLIERRMMLPDGQV
ncbi:MAG: hypothetical protein ACPHXW_04330, partial [Marinobacterium sp.]